MKVRVLSPAVDEIAEAALWYDSQKQGLGSEFWQKIDAALRDIEKNPTRFGKSEFATTKVDLRFAYVSKFKYVIHFVVEKVEIQVVSIAHAAREPGYWLRRGKA